jgi:hypothetical protein
MRAKLYRQVPFFASEIMGHTMTPWRYIDWIMEKLRGKNISKCHLKQHPETI